MRLRLAGYQGPESVNTQGLQALAAALAAAGFDPVLEPDVTAGGATLRALVDGIEAGTWQIGYIASGYLAARVPALAALDLPYAAPDRARLFAALDGAAGGMLGAAVAAASGLRVLGFWDNGLRHLSNAHRPLRAPADCAGLVIRSLDSATYRAALAAMGFRPVFLEVARLRLAVETGEVDAQENPLTNLLGFGLQVRHRFVSLTGHIQGVGLLLCHGAWLAALPAGQRDAVQAAAAAATRRQRALAAAEDARCLAALRAEGVAVLGPEAIDLAGFRAACAPVAREAAAGLDPALLAALR
jgi:TRAP-type C4-dicarboxylate transport system substrate-binding protein